MRAFHALAGPSTLERGGVGHAYKRRVHERSGQKISSFLSIPFAQKSLTIQTCRCQVSKHYTASHLAQAPCYPSIPSHVSLHKSSDATCTAASRLVESCRRPLSIMSSQPTYYATAALPINMSSKTSYYAPSHGAYRTTSVSPPEVADSSTTSGLSSAVPSYSNSATSSSYAGSASEYDSASSSGGTGVDLMDLLSDRLTGSFDPLPLDRSLATQAQT